MADLEQLVSSGAAAFGALVKLEILAAPVDGSGLAGASPTPTAGG